MFCGVDEINSFLSQEPQQPILFLSMFAYCNVDNETEDEVDSYLSLRYEDSIVNPLKYYKVHEYNFPS